MLSEEKIKLMTRLAIYEKNAGKSTMKLTKYFQSDYVGWNMIKTGVAVTVGYLLAVAVFFVYHFEEYVQELYTMDYIALGKSLVVKYLIVLAVYMAVTFIAYYVKYSQSMKSLKRYQKILKKVEADARGNQGE